MKSKKKDMSDALGHLAFLYPNFFVLFLPLGSPAFTPTEDAAAAAGGALDVEMPPLPPEGLAGLSDSELRSRKKLLTKKQKMSPTIVMKK